MQRLFMSYLCNKYFKICMSTQKVSGLIKNVSYVCSTFYIRYVQTESHYLQKDWKSQKKVPEVYSYTTCTIFDEITYL